MGTTLGLRTALLYSRHDETVHVEVFDDAGRRRLVVSGPMRRRTRDVADESALNRQLDRLHRTLEHVGYRLIASVERRRGTDRRAIARGGPDRRRA